MVDLLEQILSDVRDVHVAVARVEAEAPRIAQPVAPDLRQHARAAHVTRWDTVLAVAGSGIHVDAQHLAEPRSQVLPVAAGVALPTSVTQAEIEHSVRPEREHS